MNVGNMAMDEGLPRIAVVHDYLCGKGGTERVFQYICEEFKEADVYTLAYNPTKTFDFYRSIKISTTWLNIFVRNTLLFRLSFPIATYVMGRIDLSKYDLVISSSATVAKYVNASNGVHICYCYVPTRAIWHSEEYFSGGIKALLYKKIMSILKRNDYNAAQKIDKFIAISKQTGRYIDQYYNKPSSVLPCPIDNSMFYISEKKNDYYLLVSRLEKWKKIDYAIDAFNVNGKPLHIIGGGSEEKQLKENAAENIKFLGEVDDAMLSEEYSKAKAVIFTPDIEYGLIPIEANASGTPVICYESGGVLETMIPYRKSGKQEKYPTAVFYYEQTKESLNQAVEEFEQYKFDANELKKHADKWNIDSFKNKLRSEVEEFYEKKCAQ